jgi:hypothetical protein
MTDLRQRVREFMVEVHKITPELASIHVSEMDAVELRRRFRNYIRLGAELSAAGPTQKSGTDFYQVFGTATTTAGCAALYCAPSTGFEVSPEKSMPESEAKNLVRMPGRSLPRREFRAARVGNKKPGIAGSGTSLSGGGF